MHRYLCISLFCVLNIWLSMIVKYFGCLRGGKAIPRLNFTIKWIRLSARSGLFYNEIYTKFILCGRERGTYDEIINLLDLLCQMC